MKRKTDQELRVEWLRLDKLINDFEFNEHVLNAVIRREAADRVRPGKPVVDSGYGMFAQQAYEGYSLLIRAYIACNADTLSAQKVEKLRNALEIMEVLRQQFLDLDLLNSSSYPAYKAAEKARILALLESTGEVYTAGGYGKGEAEEAHHALIKYSKVGNVYSRTEYNEGDGVEELTDPGKKEYVWGVNKRTVSRKNLEKVISIDVETIFKSRHSLEGILPLLEPRSKDDIGDSIITTAQTLGNCSTRSVRALLRNMLGTEMLRDLYELATTPFSDIRIQLTDRFNELQTELDNRQIFQGLLTMRDVVTTKVAKENIAPQIPTPFLDIEYKKIRELCMSVIRQAEHILHGKFKQTEGLANFKENLIACLKVVRNEQIKVLPYLKPESMTVIAFIMAENLIKNKIIYLPHKTWIFDHNYMEILPTWTPSILAKITIEGLFKSLVTINGAENELGKDLAITESAFSLVMALQKKNIYKWTSDSAPSVMQAKLIAVTKVMLTSLTKPYRIDEDMLQIVEEKLLLHIRDNLPRQFNLRNVLANYQEIINSTRSDLAKIDKLKPLEKTALLEPTATPTVCKLKISPKLAKKLDAIMIKHIQTIKEHEGDSLATKPEQNQLKEVVSVPSQYTSKPEPYPAFTSGTHLETQPIAKRTRAAVAEQAESGKRARVEIPAQKKKRIREETTAGKHAPSKHHQK